MRHGFGPGNRDPRNNAQKFRGPAAQAVQQAVKAGAASYDRERDLPTLIRLEPGAGLSETPDGIQAILGRLERALRAERNRARSGHWTYDLNRHIALHQAYLAETERLRKLRAGVRE